MKKYLFLLTNMNIGGTEKAFLNMIDTFDPSETQVTLLLLEKKGGFLPFVPDWVEIKTLPDYPSFKREIMDPPIRIIKALFHEHRYAHALSLAVTHIYFKITDNRTPYYLRVLSGSSIEGEYDTAIAYAGPFDFLSVYLVYFVKAAEKIQWIHFDVKKFQFNEKTCHGLYRKIDKICVVSDEARRSFVEVMPSVSSKTVTYPNIVSAKRCRELAGSAQSFTDDWDKTRIVTLGRLSSEKGQDIIPDVAVRLRDGGIDFRWYLIGDGKLRGTVEEKIRKYGLEDSIVLLGTKENPYPFLRDADVYVQTSVHEGFCITLAEAKAFDLPIVSTDCAGAHEQLDGLPYCSVTKRDVGEMSEAIAGVIRQREAQGNTV